MTAEVYKNTISSGQWRSHNTWHKGKTREYIQDLFDIQREELITSEDDSPTGLNITREEVKHAVKLSKNNKVTGHDSSNWNNYIYHGGINLYISNLYYTIYSKGIILKEWLK